MDWNARSGVSVTCGGICDVTKEANSMLIGTESILCDVKADKSTFLGLPIEPPIRTILTVHQAITFLVYEEAGRCRLTARRYIRCHSSKNRCSNQASDQVTPVESPIPD